MASFPMLGTCDPPLYSTARLREQREEVTGPQLYRVAPSGDFNAYEEGYSAVPWRSG